MSNRKTKKPLEPSSRSSNQTRNSSPTSSLIQTSLLSSLKSFSKHSKSSYLSYQDLQNFLKKLHFTTLPMPAEDSSNLQYMWTLISRNSQIHISDAFSYILSILDIPVPKSLLDSAKVFQELNSDFSYIRGNSTNLLKNYLEHIYSKSKKLHFFVGNDLIRMKTPKFKEEGVGKVLGKEAKVEAIRKREGKERNLSAKAGSRLSRSKSNSKNHSRDLNARGCYESRKNSPGDIFSTRHKLTVHN